jgi:hypothetical protein
MNVVMQKGKQGIDNHPLYLSFSSFLYNMFGCLNSWFLDFGCIGSFTEVQEENGVSSEKLQRLGWSYRPLKETLIDSVESYRKAGLVD